MSATSTLTPASHRAVTRPAPAPAARETRHREVLRTEHVRALLADGDPFDAWVIVKTHAGGVTLVGRDALRAAVHAW